MAEPLLRALSQLRSAVLDDEHLVRALASGRRRGQPEPRWRRIELRYVDLKAGRHLQLTAYDDTQAHVSNHADPREVLDELLDEPFANWHVETTTHTHQLRVTKKGQALLHSAERQEQVAPEREPRPGQGSAAAGGPPCPGGARASPTARGGSSRRGRGSTARSRSSCVRCPSPSRTRSAAKQAAHPRRQTTRCAWSTSAAATPTSPSPRTRGCASGCRCTWSAST